MAVTSRTRTTPALADERLLTLAQVGERLGVSAVTAWRRVRAGLIPAINVGDRRPMLRVRPSDLDAYLSSRKVRPLPRGGRSRRAP